jgi:hypothetical protein
MSGFDKERARAGRWSAALAAVMAVCGCAAGGGGRDGVMDGGADTESATGTGTGSGDECEGVDFPLAGRPPTFLIVLDRSGSMQSMESWSNVVLAITEVTAQLDWQIRFGLQMFPDGQELCASTGPLPEVPVGDFTAEAIAEALAATGPGGGGTPTAMALLYSFMYLVSLDGEGERFVVLATDGAPNCSEDPGLTCAGGCISSVDGPCIMDEMCLDANSVYAHVNEYHGSWGIPTYVVGMGGVMDLWDEVMTNIAFYGGTGDYFPASNPQALADALQEIAAQNTECTFDVDWSALGLGTSSDPDLVNVEADGEVAPFSADCSEPQGWYWLDGDTIGLCPGLCHDYRWGVVHVIRATFGCESVVE